MTWQLVQKSAAPSTITSAGTVSPTLPAASTAGNLLILKVLTGGGTGAPTAVTSGFTSRRTNSQATAPLSRADLYDYINNPGGLTSASATLAQSGSGYLEEWTQSSGPPGASVAADVTGVASNAAPVSPFSIATSAAAAANDLAVDCWIYRLSSSTNLTLGCGAGFTLAAGVNQGTASLTHYGFGYKADTGTSAVQTDATTTTSTAAGSQNGLIVTYTFTGGAAVSGSASVSGTATVSAAGSVTFLGGVTRAVTATVSAAGSVAATLSSGASISATATVSAAGSQVVSSGASPVTVAAAVSADSSLVLLGQVAISTTATIRPGGAAGGVTYGRVYPRSYPWNYLNLNAGAAVAVTAAVSAAGSVVVSQGASRAITATVSAAGAVVPVLSGSASRPVTAAVSAAGAVTFLGSVTRAVTATVSAAGSVVPVLASGASVSAAAAVSAAGSVTFLSGATVSATATIGAAGAVGTGGLVTLTWTATVASAGSLTVGGGAALPVAATVSAAGAVTFLGSVTRPVTASISAAGSVAMLGQVTRPVTATISAAGSVVAMSGAAVAATVTVSAAGAVLGLLSGAVSVGLTVAVSATGYASGGVSVITGGAMPWTFWADYAVAPFADIGPVQVVGFTCDWQLSGFGSGEATVAISSNSSVSREMLMQLWTWRLWAFYAGQPVWAGCPVGVTDVGAQTVTVALSELPGYLALKQYALNHTYSAVEQCTIAADLASPLANIGVTVVTSPGPGQARDRTYTFLQAGRDQLLTDLSQVINGPEFRSEYSNPANPVCTLKLAYPRVGIAGGLGVIVPHGAISFRASWAGDMMRTRTFAVGDLPPNAPTTATRPVVTIVAPQAGLPELDHVDDWPGVSVTSTLNEYASGFAQSYASPVLSLEVVMPLMSPVLGTYSVGDDVSVVLADPLVPGGLNALGRLTQIQLDAGSGTATWTVAVTLPHPRRYASLSAQLKALHRKTAAIFHNSLAAPPGGINP